MSSTITKQIALWMAWGCIGLGGMLIAWQIVTPANTNATPLLAPTPAVLAVDVAGSAELMVTLTPVADIVVYISGAVNKPGVYKLAASARVADAVVLAGGLQPDADYAAVNLAAHISDAAHIQVERVGVATRQIPAQTTTTKVAVNHASAEELTALPGIGPALAARIVEYRTAHGAFTTMDDLGTVPGIGPAMQAKLAPLLGFDS
ncbi:MAG: ComEA family DNA-binding protein [Chloroflexales bacterium]|nr:ComEA family DNA-binding protein [Chloroflexales bacterium]